MWEPGNKAKAHHDILGSPPAVIWSLVTRLEIVGHQWKVKQRQESGTEIRGQEEREGWEGEEGERKKKKKKGEERKERWEREVNSQGDALSLPPTPVGQQLL